MNIEARMREQREIGKRPYRDAIKLAEEFITKAKEAIDDIENGNRMYCRKCASAKRCSMELSNALVAVRGTQKK